MKGAPLLATIVVFTLLEAPTNCSRTITKKLENGRMDIANRMRAAATGASVSFCKSLYGLQYRNKCYIIPYLSYGQKIYMKDAEWKCLLSGAELAEIDDRDMENVLLKFIRSRKPSSHPTIDTWLGMKWDYEDGLLHYRSGKTLDPSELDWYPRHPVGFSDEVVLGITSDIEGLWNGSKYRLPGVLCEFNITR